MDKILALLAAINSAGTHCRAVESALRPFSRTYAGEVRTPQEDCAVLCAREILAASVRSHDRVCSVAIRQAVIRMEDHAILGFEAQVAHARRLNADYDYACAWGYACPFPGGVFALNSLSVVGMGDSYCTFEDPETGKRVRIRVG